MNNAEHICLQVESLVRERRITDVQLAEIVVGLAGPFCGKQEPSHFELVNDMIHRLLDVSDPDRNKGGEDD